MLSVEKLIQKEIRLYVRLVLRNIESAVVSHTFGHAVFIIILLRCLREEFQLELCKMGVLSYRVLYTRDQALGSF